MGMMIDQNKTSYLYDEDEARLIYDKVKNNYNPLLQKLKNKMETEIDQIN